MVVVEAVFGDANADAEDDDEKRRSRATEHRPGFYIAQGKTLLCLSKATRTKMCCSF